jgi:hypothetical protein
LVAAATEALAREKTIPRSKVAPAAVRDRVLDALRARGFEVTAKVVRVSVEDQIEAVLRDGSYVAMKAIASHVRGATAAEVRRTAIALTERGRARCVLRTASETLVPASAEVVADGDLATAAKRLSELAKRVQSAARKKGWAVLREDVEQALRAVLPVRSPGGKPRESDGTPDLGRVLRAIEDASDAVVGLSFVPKVIDLLKVHADLASAQRALLDAASRGLVELRPEGGLGRLSSAELLACPEGPQGTRLSWARRIAVPS